MSWFRRKAQAPYIPMDARSAQESAQQGKREAYARSDEVARVAASLRTLHKENHLAEAIMQSMALSPRKRRRIRTSWSTPSS